MYETYIVSCENNNYRKLPTNTDTAFDKWPLPQSYRSLNDRTAVPAYSTSADDGRPSTGPTDRLRLRYSVRFFNIFFFFPFQTRYDDVIDSYSVTNPTILSVVHNTSWIIIIVPLRVGTPKYVSATVSGRAAGCSSSCCGQRPLA